MLPYFRKDYCDDDYKTSQSNSGQIRLSLRQAGFVLCFLNETNTGLQIASIYFDSKDSVQVSGTGLSPVSLQQTIPLIDIILKLYLYCIHTLGEAERPESLRSVTGETPRT